MSNARGWTGRLLRLAHQTDSEDKRLLDLIRDSYVASSGVYGSRRVFSDLREAVRHEASIALSESCAITRYKLFAATKVPRQSRAVRQFLCPNVSIVNSLLMRLTTCE